MSMATFSTEYASDFTALLQQDRVDAIRTNLNQTNRLGETIVEFSSKLGSAYEKFAGELHLLVKNYRRKNDELKRERLFTTGNFYGTWDAMLEEIDGEANGYADLAKGLDGAVVQPLNELLARKRAQSKKVLSYRDQLEEVISKADDGLQKAHKEYVDAWGRYKAQDRDTMKENDILRCHNAHNSYVLGLCHFNALANYYHNHTAPHLSKDVTEIRLTLADGMKKGIIQLVSLMKQRHQRALDRWETFKQAADIVKAEVDLENFVQSLKVRSSSSALQKSFVAPEVHALGGFLKNELLLDLLTEAALVQQHQSLKIKFSESADKCSKYERECGTLLALQKRYTECPNLGDPLPLYDDIYKQNQELRLVQLHHDGLAADLRMFASLESELEEREPSYGNVQTTAPPKLLKAGTSANFQLHNFDWHNYKILTYCSYCRGLLKGLYKQGMRCKACKMNVHDKCKSKVQSCRGQSLPRKSKSPSASSSSLALTLSRDEDDPPVIDLPPTPPERRQTLTGLRTLRKSGKKKREAGNELYNVPLTSRNPKKTASHEEVYCVAMFDYEGDNPHDLTVKAGAKLLLKDKSDSSWWKFFLDDRFGFIPSNYVQEIKPNEKIARTLYSFTPEEEDELGFAADQIVIVVLNENNGWLVGKIGEQTGAFPEGYVEIIG
ncbi:uncharacterized protein [Oscarella lobularis]|uniref:uncharacterized protein n=1 Tax=Oscarella lobularis TaxID=121494 RepID=UPI003313BDE5